MRSANIRTTLPEQIRDDLAMQIRNGIRRPGTPLPSFTQLCAHYSASLSSVNAAMRLLEKENLIRPRSHRPALVQMPKTSRTIRQIALSTSFPVEPMHYSMSPHSWLFYQGFLTAIMKRGYQCVMLPTEQYERHSTTFDGVICWNEPRLHAPFPEYSDGIPRVDFTTCLSENAWNTVSLRHTQGMYQTALYFIGYGVQSVFICQMPRHYHAELRESLEEPLCERGIAPERISFLHEEHLLDTEISRSGVEQWLESNPPRPLGILCGGDFAARTVIEVLKEHGLRLKEDAFVVGFTDVPEAARWTPPLSVQSVPYQELADAAVTMLEQRIASGKDQPSVVIDNRLIIRET